MSECRNWYNGDPILEEYHDHEWCKINHDDDFQFEMLCLEGASVGLSWQTIMHKRAAYRTAFHDFSFVGPVITYSFLQSIGIVNDHLDDCEYR